MALVGADGTPVTEFVSYGSRGHAAHVVHDARHQSEWSATLLGFIDDFAEPGPHPYEDAPILRLEDVPALGDPSVLVTMLDAAVRADTFPRVEAAGLSLATLTGLPHLRHPASEVGVGSLVSSTCRVGPGTRLARGAIVMSDLVAHDVEVGEFATLGMHSIVLGHVHIGARVAIGPGAIINNGTATRPMTIGEGAVIGTGAVVDRDVPPGAVMVSPRALPLPDWQWLRTFVRSRGR